jgi:hypothetical protein
LAATAAISGALILLVTACGGAGLANGSSVQLTWSSPKVLTAAPNDDPIYDPAGFDWNGILRHAPECDCVVLEESDTKGTVSFIAWPAGATGFTEAGTMGVILTDGRRIKVGETVTGRGLREAFSGNPPAAIPTAQDGCLLVATVN